MVVPEVVTVVIVPPEHSTPLAFVTVSIVPVLMLTAPVPFALVIVPPVTLTAPAPVVVPTVPPLTVVVPLTKSSAVTVPEPLMVQPDEFTAGTVLPEATFKVLPLPIVTLLVPARVVLTVRLPEAQSIEMLVSAVEVSSVTVTLPLTETLFASVIVIVAPSLVPVKV